MAEDQVTFRDLGLSEEILRALEEKGYGYPTRVQAEAIPPLMAWKDVIAKAPTGTGKTFAFGIPMIEHTDAESEELQSLVLAPTRELAIQICDELRSLLTYRKGIRVAVVYGGQRIETQLKALQKKPQIVVATPGRLMDHYRHKNLRLDRPSSWTRPTECWTWAFSRMSPASLTRSKTSATWACSRPPSPRRS